MKTDQIKRVSEMVSDLRCGHRWKKAPFDMRRHSTCSIGTTRFWKWFQPFCEGTNEKTSFDTRQSSMIKSRETA